MSAQEKLIQGGLELFQRHGIRQVDLDRLLDSAGVTKTTFYNNFVSKETFAREVINRFGERLLSRIEFQLEGASVSEIKQHLLSVIDVWSKLSSSKKFGGCMLLGAGTAGGYIKDPARNLAIRYKRMFLQIYQKLAIAAGVKNPKRFAAQFSLLLDGALTARYLYGKGFESEEGRKMVLQLVNDEFAKARKPRGRKP